MVQDGTGLAVDEVQADEATHGRREALRDEADTVGHSGHVDVNTHLDLD